MWRLSFLIIPLYSAVLHDTSRTVAKLCTTPQCSAGFDCLQYRGEGKCYNTTCPINEVFSLCPSMCEPSCNSKETKCDQTCEPPACVCRPGYVRYSDKCVRPDSCPQGLSTTTNSAQPTCAVLDINCLPGFHCEDTATGMRCAPNQDRNPSIPLQSLLCDRLCLAGSHCEVVKGEPECVLNKKLPSSKSTASHPCSGVVCPQGQYCELLKDIPKCVPLPGPCAAVFCAAGQCIEYDNTFGCFKTTCGLNEEFKVCATCEKTCDSVTKKCDDKCHPPACQCVEGYIRQNGECIKGDKCDTSRQYRYGPKRYT
uniref:TIL domain-containing protein n=1 Tax=Haemonchus contortus TaxID=6289 RepID=A0A7I5ED59_HAECO|nr:Protease inhibitor I8 domain containing protein [Haemonchus contortus]